MRNNSILKPGTGSRTMRNNSILKPGTGSTGSITNSSIFKDGIGLRTIRFKKFNKQILISIGIFFGVLLFNASCKAEDAGSYKATELFQVRFGTQPYELGRKLHEGDFSGPTEIVVDSQGNIYIDDFYKHRIAAFSSNGKYAREYPLGNQSIARAFHVNLDGILWAIIEHEPDGASTYIAFSPDGVPLNQRQLGGRIKDIEMFSDQQDEGHVFINNESFIFDKQTQFLTAASPTRSIEINHDNKIYSYELSVDNSQMTSIKQPDTSTISVQNDFSRVDVNGFLYRHNGLRDIEMWEPTGIKKDTVHFNGVSYGGKFVQVGGDIYQLDYLPDHPDRLIKGMKNIPSSYDQENLHYSVNTHGARIIKWQRR